MKNQSLSSKTFRFRKINLIILLNFHSEISKWDFWLQTDIWPTSDQRWNIFWNCIFWNMYIFRNIFWKTQESYSFFFFFFASDETSKKTETSGKASETQFVFPFVDNYLRVTTNKSDKIIPNPWENVSVAFSSTHHVQCILCSVLSELQWVHSA